MSEHTFVWGIIGGTLSSALIGIVPAITVVLICIIIDFITGVFAAVKNDEKIESHKMRETIFKTLAYLSVIILCAFVDEAINSDWHLAVFVSGFCSVNEIVSVIENWGRITKKDYLGNLKDFLTERLNKNKH